MDTRANWEANATAWTELARAGYDVYRDSFNTPAFLGMLPPVRGLYGLDLGCGEGHNTRLLAELGAQMTGLDHSCEFIRYAAAERGARYVTGDAAHLPFGPAAFDFATAFMSFMDMPQLPAVLAEVSRILRPGGFLQFSITHPCFNPPHRRNLRDQNGRTFAIEVGDYYQEGIRVETWLFSAAPQELRRRYEPFVIPGVHRTLSGWLNLLTDTGFLIERLGEPKPSDEALKRWPAVQDAQVVSYFLHVRVRKPGSPHPAALSRK